MIVSIVLMCVGLVAKSQNLTLEVRDIENLKGYLMVAIYNSKESYRKSPVSAFRVEVKDKVMILPCQGLPAGTYAIALYHDENNNGVLDTGAYGRPTEKYGFSNDAEGVMGEPPYEKCSFVLKADTTMVIHLK